MSTMDEKPADTEPNESGPEARGGQGDVESELAAREEALRACEDKVLRMAAELENFKKRIEREKADHMRFAVEGFARELLPFVDNLERAVAASSETGDVGKLLEGLKLTLCSVTNTLEHFGLKAFAAEGQRFDPRIHEALCTEEHHDMDEDTVVKELLKGYMLHERVLRPALVVVAKKPGAGSGQGETSA